MPVERVPDTDLSYYLIAFDAQGRERTDGPDGAMSRRACADVDMQGKDRPYEFRAGREYNLAGSNFIRNGGGASGAHSDIAHPEVGHVIWSAALA
jgi:hypothetical protein